MLRVSSGFQTLENNKTTRPAASWFQMFSRVWKPDETLALVFEIVREGVKMSPKMKERVTLFSTERNKFKVFVIRE